MIHLHFSNLYTTTFDIACILPFSWYTWSNSRLIHRNIIHLDRTCDCLVTMPELHCYERNDVAANTKQTPSSTADHPQWTALLTGIVYSFQNIPWSTARYITCHSLWCRCCQPTRNMAIEPTEGNVLQVAEFSGCDKDTARRYLKVSSRYWV